MKKLLVAFLLLPALAALAQSYSIDWFTIAGGGGASSGSGYTLEATIGQWDAGQMTGGSDILDGGFWSIDAPGAALSKAIFDNTGGSENGYEGATTNTWLANKFCLGPQPYQLDSVTLLLVSGDNNGEPRIRSVRLQIYSNDPLTGKPSASTGIIMNLSGATNPIALPISYTPAPIAWVPATPFTLFADTCYWAVLSLDSGASVGQVDSFSLPTGTAAAFGRTSSTDGGATWRSLDDNGSNRKMLIQGTALPLPPKVVITAVARIGNGLSLSFTSAPGQDFVIQTRADLVSGAWQILSGATFSSAGGTTVVTVPLALQQPQGYCRVQLLP